MASTPNTPSSSGFQIPAHILDDLCRSVKFPFFLRAIAFKKKEGGLEICLYGKNGPGDLNTYNLTKILQTEA